MSTSKQNLFVKSQLFLCFLGQTLRRSVSNRNYNYNVECIVLFSALGNSATLVKHFSKTQAQAETLMEKLVPSD